MGTDKAFLDWGGEPLVLRPLAALRAAGLDPVFAVGGDTAALGGLGIDVAADPHQGAGPLAGVAAALERAGRPVVVVACDMPDLTPQGVRTVADAVAGHDVAIPVVDGRLEPLHAAWAPSALGAVQAGMGDSVRSILHRLDVVYVEGLDPAMMRNINEPRDTLGT